MTRLKFNKDRHNVYAKVNIKASSNRVCHNEIDWFLPDKNTQDADKFQEALRLAPFSNK